MLKAIHKWEANDNIDVAELQVKNRHVADWKVYMKENPNRNGGDLEKGYLCHVYSY